MICDKSRNALLEDKRKIAFFKHHYNHVRQIICHINLWCVGILKTLFKLVGEFVCFSRTVSPTQGGNYNYYLFLIKFLNNFLELLGSIFRYNHFRRIYMQTEKCASIIIMTTIFTRHNINYTVPFRKTNGKSYFQNSIITIQNKSFVTYMYDVWELPKILFKLVPKFLFFSR